ncbi:pilus assembly protein [Sphingomonas sp. AX6]|uniref:pilus assembly protein n=1 Tax=Sphingomonas sp. AX6 TaxID=2653171 RepID=UPI0012F43C7F|nr:TadE/TadG family type IV pilus assembly protein [Sphingomonas sp. AX6]VXC95301.1 conserved hypothetical protein [Sphingomonas sp. AX6]
MTTKRPQRRSFRATVAALIGDRRGNALALTAAAIVPCIAVVGSAVDISRYYIMQSRLQNACDSAVLAGRKSMTGLEWATKDEGVARNFFNFNFPAGMMGAGSPVIDFDTTADGQVNAAATVLAPTVLMSLFGFDDKTLTAACTAELQLPNTDVVFALDTTLSMNESNPGEDQSRITGLRSAVSNFHSALSRAATSGAQVRYGFVPFSSTVNVGHFMHRDWMVDRWTYQSRVTDGTRDRVVEGSTGPALRTDYQRVISGGTSTHDTSGSPENCVAPPNTYSTPGGWREISRTTHADGNYTIIDRITQTGSQYGASLVGGLCRIRETRYNNQVQERSRTSYTATSDDRTVTDYFWNYRPVEYDVRPLKGTRADGLMAGGSITAQIANNHGSLTTTWGGCIEERDTVRNASYNPIPAAAYDLDVDLTPTAGTPATQWRPLLPQLVYVRRSTTNWRVANDPQITNNYTRGDNIQASLASVCPSRAQKLKTMSASEITTYMNGLQTAGWTYLDIGMLWAGRLISPTGLFRNENSTAANGGSISRHLIFMTDGQIQTFIRNYDAYGLSALDRRRTAAGSLPTDADQNQIVSDRFDALCSAIKSKGITIWTVAFGTSLTSQLQSCASGNDRAFSAQNAAQLNAAFEDIASKIAQLRLTD